MAPDNLNNIDDLLSNDSFKRWILDNDATDAVIWNQWLQDHPEKLELVAAAKVLIFTMDDTAGLTDNEIDHEIHLFRNVMQKVGEVPEHAETRPFMLSFSNYWIKAAAILILVAGAWLAYRLVESKPESNSYEQFLTDNLTHNIEYANNTDSVQQFIIADGTAVSLDPGSRVSVAKNYATEKREVFLTGNAFFNVTKNASSPFIVYSKDLITKVLGTSFWIKHNGDSNQTSVIVKTGRVSVFKPAVAANGGNPELNGIILTPNQQILYDAVADKMKKSLIAFPESPEPVSDTDFSFDDTPADQVFKKLEKIYGINILFDTQILSSCSVSAALGNESFYEKLTIICRIIHADYQTVDGNIIINSKGCK